MDAQFFRQHNEGKRELPLRKKACSDCAVKCGLYDCFSNALKNTDMDTQIFASKRWYCHQTPMCACKGNADNLNISWNHKEIA